ENAALAHKAADGSGPAWLKGPGFPASRIGDLPAWDNPERRNGPAADACGLSEAAILKGFGPASVSEPGTGFGPVFPPCRFAAKDWASDSGRWVYRLPPPLPEARDTPGRDISYPAPLFRANH